MLHLYDDNINSFNEIFGKIAKNSNVNVMTFIHTFVIKIYLNKPKGKQTNKGSNMCVF